ILIDSGGLKRQLSAKSKWRSSFIRLLGKTLKQIDKQLRCNSYEHWFIPRFASTDYKNAGPLRNILVKAVTEDVSADASKIQQPALILWGEQDQETPVEMGQRFHSLIRHSRLIIL